MIYAYDRELTCDVFSSSLAQDTHGSEGEVLLPEGGTIGRLTTNLYVWNAATNSRELVTTSLPNHPEWSTVRTRLAHRGRLGALSRVAFSIKGSEGIELPVEAKSSVYAPSASIYEWNRGGKEKLASIVPVLEGAETVEKPAAQEAPNGRRIAGLGLQLNLRRRQAAVLHRKGDQRTRSRPLAEEATFNIYDRVEGTHTVEISATANPGVEDTGARFEGASSNGERVFFLANHGLTLAAERAQQRAVTTQSGETHSPRAPGCDLYEFRDEGEVATSRTSHRKYRCQWRERRGRPGIARAGDTSTSPRAGGRPPKEDSVAENETGCKTVNVYAYHAGNT